MMCFDSLLILSIYCSFTKIVCREYFENQHTPGVVLHLPLQKTSVLQKDISEFNTSKPGSSVDIYTYQPLD